MNHPSYEATIRSRKIYGCPYCSGRYVLPGVTDLASVNPSLASEWDLELNEKTPSDVSCGSDYLAWWRDELNHSWQQKVEVRSRGVGCPQCAQTGFSSTLPGYLYLIKNEKFLSRKVGITNVGIKSDRLAAFQNEGWAIERLWEGSGAAALRAETVFFRWLRKEMGIPPHLTPSELSKTGGWSETFSLDFLEEQTIVQKIDQLIATENLEIKRK